jgi:hypothetical protein
MSYKKNNLGTNKNRKTSSALPLFEPLEDRQLRSATPLSFNGQYIDYAGGYDAVMNLSHASTNLSSYSGNYLDGYGHNVKVTAAEANNALKGTISGIGAFTATLSNNTLNIKVAGKTYPFAKQITGLKYGMTQSFEYGAPAGWVAQESSAGLIIRSADGTQEVELTEGIGNGYISPQSIVAQAKSAGTSILKTASSQMYTDGSGDYYSEEAAAVSFKSAGKAFGSIVMIGSVYSSYYNASLVTMQSITAPQASFAKDELVLAEVFNSIHLIPQTGAARPASAAAAQSSNTARIGVASGAGAVFGDYYTDDYGYYYTDGFYDPGVEGDWSYGDNYWSSPYVAAEQEEMAYQSSVEDEEFQNFDDYINE